MGKTSDKKCGAEIYTTIFTTLGIYVTFIVLAFTKDKDVLGEILKAEASLGGLYVNLLAVISVAFSKFAREMFVHRNAYWLSLAAFIVAISIFASQGTSGRFHIRIFTTHIYIIYTSSNIDMPYMAACQTRGIQGSG